MVKPEALLGIHEALSNAQSSRRAFARASRWCAQWMWMVGDHRAEHGWFENGILQTLQFAMENHNFSWVNYAKSQFFMGTLFKITIFHW